MKKICLSLALLWSWPHCAAAQPALAAVEKTVAVLHRVDAITHDELRALLTSEDSAQVVLFDTRSAEEFAVSRIAGAVRIDPEMPAEAFLAQYGEAIGEKKSVFYCSVGYRSSIFIKRLQEQTAEQKSLALFNLTGGIFRWFNENRPVVNARQDTHAVHPYDAFWGNLLRQRTLPASAGE